MNSSNSASRASDIMPIDFQPQLRGERITLRPLAPADWDDLYAVASDPLIWEQHPASDRYQKDVFRAFFNEALGEAATGFGGAFAIIDNATGRIIGSTRYHGYDAVRSEIEVGWTFLARTHWGGTYNAEMKRLMLDYMFQFVEAIIFLVGETNIRSRTAVERLGAVNTRTEAKRAASGRTINHIVYRLTKTEHQRRTAQQDNEAVHSSA